MKKRGQNRSFSLYNFSSKNRKGLSTIVITLIIILISLVAVGIIWVVVRNVIQKGADQLALGQFTLDAKITDVTTQNTSNNVTLTVRRNAGQGAFSKIKFVFSDGKNSEVLTELVSLNQLEERRFILHLSLLNVSNLVSISIVPILDQDGNEILGNVLDKYTVGKGSEQSQTPPVADTTAPVLSNPLPTGTLPSGTTSIAFNVTTDEAATCRYSLTSGVSYDSMTKTFSTTGGIMHVNMTTGLTDGVSRTYYVRCNDSVGNNNTNDYPISFSVASAVTVLCGPSRTYYIDYENGNDANNGTCSNSAWKRQPYMRGFTGSYTHLAGDKFIFKGGVTWPNSCFRMFVPAGGLSESIRDYYGVDVRWYKGASWTRPIWDMEDSETATYNHVMYIDSWLSYITVDNIEVIRFYWTGASSWPNDHMFPYGTSQYITFKNMYIHSWSHGTTVQGTSDDGMIFVGQTSPPFNPGVIIEDSVIDGSRTSDSMYVTYAGSDIIRRNVIHDVVNGVLSTGSTAATHKVYDNHIYNIRNSFDPAMHENALYFIGGGYLYNNVVHDIEAGMAIYPNPGARNDMSNQYIYNNIVWGYVGSNGPITIDVSSTIDYTGTVYIFNNIIFAVSDGTGSCIRTVPRGFTIANMIVQNNHFITSNPNIISLDGPVVNLIQDHNLNQTPTVANNQGYNSSNYFAPRNATASTVNNGTSLSSFFTTDINGISRPQGSAWDIGAYEYV